MSEALEQLTKFLDALWAGQPKANRREAIMTLQRVGIRSLEELRAHPDVAEGFSFAGWRGRVAFPLAMLDVLAERMRQEEAALAPAVSGLFRDDLSDLIRATPLLAHARVEDYVHRFAASNTEHRAQVAASLELARMRVREERELGFRPLSAHQAFAIALFTTDMGDDSSFYRHFNRACEHRGSRDDIVTLMPYMKLLDSALRCLPAFTSTAFRGTPMTAGQLAGFEVGRTKTFATLRGASAEEAQARHFAAATPAGLQPVLLELRDAPCRAIKSYSPIPSEEEVMIGFDTKWHVESKTTEGDLTRVVLIFQSVAEVHDDEGNPPNMAAVLAAARWWDVDSNEQVSDCLEAACAFLDEDAATQLRLFFNLRFRAVGINLAIDEGSSRLVNPDGLDHVAVVKQLGDDVEELRRLQHHCEHVKRIEGRAAVLTVPRLLGEGITTVECLEAWIEDKTDGALAALGFKGEDLAALRFKPSTREAGDASAPLAVGCYSDLRGPEPGFSVQADEVMWAAYERRVQRRAHEPGVGLGVAQAGVRGGATFLAGATSLIDSGSVAALSVVSAADGFTAVGLAAAQAGVHLYRWYRGDITAKQLGGAIVKSTLSAGGVVLGLANGALVGGLVAGPVGSLVGAAIGAIISIYFGRLLADAFNAWLNRIWPDRRAEPLQRRKEHYAALDFLGVDRRSARATIMQACNKGLRAYHPDKLRQRLGREPDEAEEKQCRLECSKYLFVKEKLRAYFDAVEDALVALNMDPAADPCTLKVADVRAKWKAKKASLAAQVSAARRARGATAGVWAGSEARLADLKAQHREAELAFFVLEEHSFEGAKAPQGWLRRWMDGGKPPFDKPATVVAGRIEAGASV